MRLLGQRSACAAAMSFLTAATALSAQDDPPRPSEATASIQFSFSNPGARSLGMGGAFAGLAADATTAYANPAGLILMPRPEVSVEARAWSYDTPYVERGRTSGNPSGDGIDTSLGTQNAASRSRVENVSFLSFAYPRERWAFGIYRHRLLDFRASTASQGLFVGPTRRRARSSSSTLQALGTGLAVAFELSPRLSLGATLVEYDIELHSNIGHHDFACALRKDCLPGEEDGELNISSSNRLFGLRVEERRQALSANLGILWSINPRWRLGAVIRKGRGFDFTEEVLTGPLAESLGLAKEGEIRLQRAGDFRIPDVVSLGASYREGAIVASIEYSRITYSRLFRPNSVPQGSWRIDDGEEIRLGFEYTWWGVTLIPGLRAGIWVDPDHRVRFERASPSQGEWFTALFPPGSDELHFTIGGGIVLAERFQLDVAYDYSRRFETGSLSFVYRF